MPTHLAFGIRRSALRERVLIPKFYDPELAESARLASDRFDTPELGELLLPGSEGSRLGNWLEREHYGTGSVPFVRTSDLSHWRIRPDVKKGVSEILHAEYAAKQDVRPLDILFVAHGTYLVGEVAVVTQDDEKLVLQDHVFRLRVSPSAGVHPLLLLAALSTGFVRRQVRSRQFSADIIDKIGERHLGLRVPLPKDQATRDGLARRVQAVVASQSRARREIERISESDLSMLPARAAARHGFTVRRAGVHNRVLIPKYYDPALEADLADAEARDGGWVTLGSLVEDGVLTVGAGVEVGKMAYGTGDIPFVRTSDLVNWEVKLDTKHGVGSSVYDEHKAKASLQSGDVLVVRDGTYLVGSSALVTEDDLPALFSGGVLRLRSREREALDANFILAALNLPLVRRQMRARQFTRDVIDTLGQRVLEVKIPPPGTANARRIGAEVADAMALKASAKREIGAITRELEPPTPPASRGRPGWSMR